MATTIASTYHQRPPPPWTALMDFRHLQQFLVLADTLNFHRAAEKLHMSQPPLSVSIRKLEESVGVALFVSSKGRARPLPPRLTVGC